jgi:hypothetical protein
MGVVVWRDDGCETAVKGNDGSGWSSDGIVLWLARRQNGDTIECWGRVDKVKMIFFITVEGVSRAVQGGWAAVVVRIQCLGFGSKGEAMGWSIAGRWSGGIELVLTLWEGSMTQHMALSAGGEVALGRGMEKTISIGLTWILLDQK